MKSMMKAIVGAGVLAGLAQTSFANGYNYRFHSENYHHTSEYVDFSAKSPFGNHTFWPKETHPESMGQLRTYYALQLQGSGNGTCYSFGTSGASQPASNTDLIAVMGNTIIDDNGPGNSLMPFFKIWAQSGTNFKIMAKTSGADNADWNMTVTSSVMSQAACINAYGGPNQPLITSTGQVIVPKNLNN